MADQVAPLPPNTRHDEPVQEYGPVGTATNKVNFVVPVSKNLFIEHWHACISEGDKMIIELQDDGVGLACIANGEAKDGGRSMPLPQFNPLGPIAAGSVVRLSRVVGASGKDWSGGFIGYLEDE